MKELYCLFYNKKENKHRTFTMSTTNSKFIEYLQEHGWEIVEFRSYR